MDQHQSNALQATFLFVFLASVYAYLTSSFPMLEDDGLFILGAYDAGTAHAPGYPLFILLSQLFLWLPFGTVAFQVHLVNVTLASLSCSLLYLYLVCHTGVSRIVAMMATLSLAFSGLFFSQALVAEAYMLNAFLLVCLLWISVLPLEANHRYLFAGFVTGLALSNHWPLMLLLAPALIAVYWPVLMALKQSPVALLVRASCGLATGLLPYAWMYLTSADDKFSHMGHFESLTVFFGFILRDVYGNIDQSGLSSLSTRFLYLEAYVQDFSRQYSLLVLPLVLLGTVVQWRVLPFHLALGLTLTLALPLCLTGLLDIPYQPEYLAAALAYPLPLYAVMAVWLALGAQRLCQSLPRPGHVVLGVLVVCAVITQNHQVPEENNSDWSRNIALQIMYALPDDAVLFVSNNWSMAQISYLHYLEGVRPDITLASEYGAFLPERFSYFLSDDEKITLLRDFIGHTSRDLYMLAPLRMINVPAIDLGLYYAINGPWNTTPVKAALAKKPLGKWNQLYWRELVDRNIQHFSLEDVLEINEAELTLTFCRFLMNQDTFDPARVAELLTTLDQKIENDNRFNRAEHALLKGRLMELTGNEELAAEFYALAAKLRPGLTTTKANDN